MKLLCDACELPCILFVALKYIINVSNIFIHCTKFHTFNIVFIYLVASDVKLFLNKVDFEDDASVGLVIKFHFLNKA